MDGFRHFGRDRKELIKTYNNISKNRLRIWLVKTLISENLATRDIHTFARNQSELRSIIKSLDRKTMTSAMRTKLKDMKLVLSKNIYKKKFSNFVVIFRSSQNLSLGASRMKGLLLQLQAADQENWLTSWRSRLWNC